MLNSNMLQENNIDNKNIVVEVNNIQKSFGKNEILTGVHFKVEAGKNLVLLGKSGSGKSVIIKCIVGLVAADSGSIQVLGQEVISQNEKKLNELRMQIGFLFQSGALYDSMTVKENLSFALRRNNKTLTEKKIDEDINEVLTAVGLLHAINKMPSELSGGMRKRIALARTVISKPKIMLYDEPTTGLDNITSREISELMVAIQKKYKTTSIIITHDMACAKLTADTIAILKDGKIHAQGTYDALANSEDEWVKSFFI